MIVLKSARWVAFVVPKSGWSKLTNFVYHQNRERPCVSPCKETYLISFNINWIHSEDCIELWVESCCVLAVSCESWIWIGLITKCQMSWIITMVSQDESMWILNQAVYTCLNEKNPSSILIWYTCTYIHIHWTFYARWRWQYVNFCSCSNFDPTLLGMCAIGMLGSYTLVLKESVTHIYYDVIPMR